MVNTVYKGFNWDLGLSVSRLSEIYGSGFGLIGSSTVRQVFRDIS